MKIDFDSAQYFGPNLDGITQAAEFYPIPDRLSSLKHGVTSMKTMVNNEAVNVTRFKNFRFASMHLENIVYFIQVYFTNEMERVGNMYVNFVSSAMMENFYDKHVLPSLQITQPDKNQSVPYTYKQGETEAYGFGKKKTRAHYISSESLMQLPSMINGIAEAQTTKESAPMRNIIWGMYCQGTKNNTCTDWIPVETSKPDFVAALAMLHATFEKKINGNLPTGGQKLMDIGQEIRVSSRSKPNDVFYITGCTSALKLALKNNGMTKNVNIHPDCSIDECGGIYGESSAKA